MLLKNSNIHFYSETHLQQSKLLGSVSCDDPIASILVLNDEYFVSISQFGHAAVWSCVTLEKISDFNFGNEVALAFAYKDVVWFVTHKMEFICVQWQQNLKQFVKYSADIELSSVTQICQARIDEKDVCLFCTLNGRIYSLNINDLVTESFLQELFLPIEKSKITTLQLHNTGVLILSNNKNEIYVFSSTRSQQNELHFLLTFKISNEIVNKFDYQWGKCVADNNGLNLYCIFNNCSKVFVYEIRETKVK